MESLNSGRMVVRNRKIGEDPSLARMVVHKKKRINERGLIFRSNVRVYIKEIHH